MFLNENLLEKAVRQTRKHIPKGTGVSLRRRKNNAISKAARNLLDNPFIHFEDGKLLILSDSRAETGEAKFYETSKKECRLTEPRDALCHAFWEGFPCWHRAAFEIVRNYLEITKSIKIINFRGGATNADNL